MKSWRCPEERQKLETPNCKEFRTLLLFAREICSKYLLDHWNYHNFTLSLECIHIEGKTPQKQKLEFPLPFSRYSDLRILNFFGVMCCTMPTGRSFLQREDGTVLLAAQSGVHFKDSLDLQIRVRYELLVIQIHCFS